mgnify:FL=1
MTNKVSKYKIGDKVIYNGDGFKCVGNIKNNNRIGNRSSDSIWNGDDGEVFE